MKTLYHIRMTLRRLFKINYYLLAGLGVLLFSTVLYMYVTGRPLDRAKEPFFWYCLYALSVLHEQLERNKEETGSYFKMVKSKEG